MAVAAWPPDAADQLEAPLASSQQSQGQGREMEVLARHCARLGRAAPGLEATLRGAPRFTEFLTQPEGRRSFFETVRRFREVYGNFSNDDEGRLQADAQVRVLLPYAPTAPPPQLSGTPPDSRARPPSRHVAPGIEVDLPLQEIRFAHDQASEKFHDKTLSILQLGIEIIAGIKDLDDMKQFEVVSHGGLWWCQTGHRRLAALRLAERYVPGRFSSVRVKVAAIDDRFLCPDGDRRQKLRTQCAGRWMVITETGEVVGGEDQGLNDYAADLLSLVCPGQVKASLRNLGCSTANDATRGLTDAPEGQAPCSVQ